MYKTKHHVFTGNHVIIFDITYINLSKYFSDRKKSNLNLLGKIFYFFVSSIRIFPVGKLSQFEQLREIFN